MRKKKWIARFLAAAIVINTMTGYVPPQQGVQAGQARAGIDAGTDAVREGGDYVKRVSLNPAGGEVSVQEITVVAGEPYGTLPTPVRNGYDFLGWFTQEEGGIRVDETSAAGTAAVLYAHYEPLTVRLDLYAVGGEADAAEIQVTFGKTYEGLPTPVKAGFTFDGWYTAYDGGERVNKTDIVTATSAMPLYAHWRGKEVTVSFRAVGALEAVPDRTAEYGMAYGSLPQVSREGYLFAGWYDSEQGGRRVHATTPVLSDKAHTLYAQWSEEETRVTLNADGGECGMTELAVYHGIPVGTLPTPEKAGHIFLGWYAGDGEEKIRVTEKTEYTTELGTVFYARWEGIRLNLTLQPCMEGGKKQMLEVVCGKPYPKLPELTRANYDFLGWFTKPEKGDKIEAGADVKLKTDTTLYAHWAGKQHTVSFDANGGTVREERVTVTYGTLYGTLPTPARTGYRFDGWYMADGEGVHKVEKNDAVALTGDAVLTAHWSPKRPEISFHANGGSMYFNGVQSSLCTAPYYYDKPYGELPVPKREGYTFLGWFTDKTDGIQVFSSTPMLFASASDLYAHWSGNRYTVTLDPQGGELGQKLYGVTFGEKYGELPVPQKENYTFTGWELGSELGGTSVNATVSVKVAADHILYATYRGNSIKLVYDNNGGSEGSTTFKTVYYGEAVGTLRSPVRSGYEFLGWFADGERITKDTVVTLTRDTTIRAEWKKKGYTVTFDANGGECGTEERIYENGDVYGALPVPVRTGFTFQGWFTEKTSGTQIKGTDTVKLSADDRLYARWEANAYTVTLDLNGGTATSQSKKVTYGGTYGTLPTPKRTGFTFAGWFTKKQYGYKVTSSSHVETAQDHVLYACWKQETFVITFEANGGTVAYRYIGIPAGTGYSAFPVPEKSGYVFDGWYTSSTSGTKITYLTETDTLYAHWKPDTYQVRFDSCGGTACGALTVTYAKTYGTLPTPVKTGFSFAGWYTEPEGGTKVSSASSVKKAYDHTLYAHWSGVVSKLSYDANGGSSVTSTKSITSGKEYGTLATTSYTGHKFLGWYTAREGGTLITPDTIVTVIQDQKLYAHWEVLRPVIRFAACGGNIFTAEGNVGTLEVQYTYGQKYSAFPKISRTGYRFLGWFTGQTTGEQVTEQMVCEVTATDTYYARWEGIASTVRFDTNGGTTEASPVTVTYGKDYGTLPDAERPGYTFSGWYTARDAGEKILSSTEVEILADQILYAHWEQKTYRVTLDGNGGTSSMTSSSGTTSSVTTRTVNTTYGGTYGGSTGQLPMFSRTGYEFAGFYTEAEGGSEITAQSPFLWQENRTVYAHWTPKNIVVSFYEDGGSPVGEVRRVSYKEAYGVLPVPEKAGYVFDGFRTIRGGSTPVTADTVMKKTDGHVLYAAWIPKEYTITFDSVGGEPAASTKTVTAGQSIGICPKPTKEGYQFSGWYTKPAGGIAVKSTTKCNVPGDVRYYAHWEQAGVQVRLLADGKSAGTKELGKGDCYGELPAAEKEGYDFTGWFTAETGGEEVTASDHVGASDTVLYAHFKAKTPTLLFYANGGNLTPASKVVTYKKTCGTLPVPTLHNYEFAGWYTEPAGGTRITEALLVTFSDTTVCYALWNPAALFVSFDPCGGSVTTGSKNLYYEKPYGELPVPVREGFVFAGWFTQADGGQQVLPASIVREQKSHTLYAHWDKACRRLYFDAGEGSCAVASKELAAGDAYGELPEAVRAGYRFTGWYTAADGGSRVAEDEIFAGDENVTVYAHWEVEHYTVTFDAMGGACAETQKEIVFGEAYGQLPTPEYEGFCFAGWYLEVAGQNRVTEDSPVETAGDHTLYAYYVAEEKDVHAGIRSFHFGEPGANPVTGNVSFSVTDMMITVPGVEYEITRTYNSQDHGESVLGRGWSFGFDAGCEVYSDGVIVYLPDGSSDVLWLLEDGSYESRYSRRTAGWGSDGILTVTEPDRKKYHFDRSGTLACIEDRYGNRTEASYTDGKLSALTDAAGRRYTVETEDGKLTRLTDPMGHEVLYAYDEKGYLASVTNVLGGTTKYTYDENGYLKQIINPDGAVVQRFIYGEDRRPIGGGADGADVRYAPAGLFGARPGEMQGWNAGTGLLAAEPEEAGKERQCAAEPEESAKEKMQAANRTAEEKPQDFGLPYRETEDEKPVGGDSEDKRPIFPGSVEENRPETSDVQVTTYIDANGNAKTYTYDPEKKQTRVSSADGREWIYWYNSDMYVTAVQNPDGSMETTEYAPQEEGCHYADIASETDEFGRKTTYTRDARGNITMITYADGSTETMWYDTWDNCVMHRGPNSIHTYYVYDAEGVCLLKTVRRLNGAAIAGATAQNIPEQLGGITCADADYIVEEYRYYTDGEAREKFDSKLRGLLAETTNPEGEVLRYAYDAYGNMAAVTDAAGNTRTYTYDAMGHRLSETTARGDVYRWEYLANGYVTRQFYPDGGTAVSVYDTSGRLVQDVKPEQYEPDQDADGVYGGTAGTFYRYRADGRLLATTSALGDVTNYTYDINGNVTAQARQGAEVISYAYDERDRLIGQWYQETVSAPKQTLEVYRYETLENGERRVTTDRYTDEENRITQVTVYDCMERQKEVYLLADGEKAEHKQYTYYPDGALHTVTEGGYTTTWQYDVLGNAFVCEEPSGEEDGILHYKRTENKYDRAGRLVETRIGKAGGEASYVTRCRYENGRLAEEVSPSGIHTYYTYDADGNIIREQTGDGTVGENTALVTEAAYDFRGNPLTRTLWVRAADLGISGGQEPVAPAVSGMRAGIRHAQESMDTLCALTATFTYDLGGRLVKETAPDGVTVHHAYDAAGNETATEIRNPDGTLASAASTVYNKRGQAVQMTDALGAVTKYTYDNRGNTIKTEDALGGVALYAYDYCGQLTAEVSPANYRAGRDIGGMARTEYAYDAAGRILTQTDYVSDGDGTNPAGLSDGTHAQVTATHLYDGAGNNIQTLDAEGRGAVRTFRPDGLVASEESAAEQAKPDGVTVSYRYDILGNTVGIRAGDYEKRYSYDPEGRLLSESDGYGTLGTYTYDALGRLRAGTDAAGGVTYYEYNAFGQVSRKKLPGDASVPGLEVSYTYDRMGRLLECADSAGNRTAYTYDSLGNVLTQTVYDTQTGEAATVSYTYDANGNLTSMTDVMGNYTEYRYDALGRKTGEAAYVNGRGQAPKATEWGYDADGNNTLVRDYLGNEVRAEYDSLGRVTAQYDAFGNRVAAYRYDGCGRQVSSTDALGNVTAYAYDGDGNATTVTAPDGAATAYTYDYAGNTLSETDPNGNRTLYNYDGRGRLVAVVDALGGTYRYTYDNAGNRTGQSDPAGRGITYTYNVRGDLAARQYTGEDTAESYRYTADGLLAEKTDRNGTRTVYAYDGFGRLSCEQAGSDRKDYTYDRAGNLLTASDGGVVTACTYDAEGRVTSKAVDGVGTASYTYDLDAAGGEVSERAAYPDGSSTATTYDRAGRIRLVVSGDGTSAEELYYADGSRRATVYGDGSRQEYSYDAAGHVTCLVHRDAGGAETERYAYTYDADGNLTREEDSRGVTSYTYDALDRLVSVEEPDGKVTEYTYDASGNRAGKTERHGGAMTRTRYTYDAANLLIRQECDDGTVTVYAYDANGNLVSEETLRERENEAVAGDQPAGIPVPEAAETVTGSAVGGTDGVFPAVAQETVSGSAIRRYTYDGFNRLVSYRSGDTFAAYTYDAGDYRVAKQTTGPEGEGYTRYFYEGSRVVLEADADGAITAHNTYSINLASRTAGEETYYYFYNAHGDVVGLSGAGGGEVVRYRYDAFGTPVSVEGDADNSITYAGYQYDAESGLYYLNARYYDSMTARFLTEDTYGGRAGDPLSLHRYTYCANNPLRYTDPSGHFFGALLRFVGGAVIGGVIEYVNQKFIEKREKVDWKAVAYEALVGGASSVFGGAGKQVAEGVGNAVGGVAKKVAKAAATEALWGGVEDIGKQVFVDGKAPGEFDYGELFDTMATAGVGGVFGAAVDFYADYRKHARLKKVPVPVEVERIHYECVYHVPDCPNHVSNIRVVTKDTKWEMQEVWEYGGTDRSFMDYLGARAEKKLGDGGSRNITAPTSAFGNNVGKIENITKDDILNFIDGVTEKSTEIAGKIREKKIGISILSDELFEKWTGMDSSTVALQVKKQIYLRKNSDSASLFSSVVHEATHALDYLNDMPEDMIGRWPGEIRAYTEERLFQIAAGLPVDFERLEDMMVHIWMKYER